MPKKDSFIINRIKSVGCAFNGALLLLKTESSIQIQVFCAILLTIAGFYFNISTTEWLIQCLAIGLILTVEAVNTAIEKIADFIHPDFNKKIGTIKDVAAGAVFIAAISAIIIGLIIYIPKMF